MLTFWFDVHSPWCYLAARRIHGIAVNHNRALEWRPLHLPRLIQAIGGRRPLEENAAFVAWYKEDLQDWARRYGLTVKYHPKYPLRNSRALRTCLYAADHGLAHAFVPRLLKAYWEEGADITDLDLFAVLAEEVGLDPGHTRAAALSEQLKARVEGNTAEAIRRGLFGVPTVDTGAKLFFGNDRLEMLEAQLELGR